MKGLITCNARFECLLCQGDIPSHCLFLATHKTLPFLKVIDCIVSPTYTSIQVDDLKEAKLIKSFPGKPEITCNLVLLPLSYIIRIAMVIHERRTQGNILTGSLCRLRSAFYSSKSRPWVLLVLLCSGPWGWWWKMVPLEHVWGSGD